MKRTLSFIQGDALRIKYRQPGYIVRVFDPRGQYPMGRIAHRDALYFADDQLVFTVTYGQRWDWLSHEGAYSEMDWATPQELKFLSSILLCEDIEGPLVRFYPVYRFAPRLDVEDLDLTQPDTAVEVRRLLVVLARSSDPFSGGGAVKLCLEGEYNLIPPEEEHLHLGRQPEFWERITLDDHLLLRGVASLIKAEMLAVHREFWEEATIISFIALEASFQMVLRRLRSSGHPNPTSEDAGRWLTSTFDKPLGIYGDATTKYFGDLYEQRVMTLHPLSRHGISLYAPLMHDDYSMVRRDVRAIFAYLVSGQHGPDYQRELERQQKERASQEEILAHSITQTKRRRG